MVAAAETGTEESRTWKGMKQHSKVTAMLSQCTLQECTQGYSSSNGILGMLLFTFMLKILNISYKYHTMICTLKCSEGSILQLTLKWMARQTDMAPWVFTKQCSCRFQLFHNKCWGEGCLPNSWDLLGNGKTLVWNSRTKRPRLEPQALWVMACFPVIQ